MTKVKPKTTSESGITLIALLVMIILIVILASVAIQNIGGDGLLDTAKTVASDYKLAEQKEQLDQIVRGEIIANETTGKETTLKDVADKLKENKELVSEVEIDGDENATTRIHIYHNNRRFNVPNLLRQNIWNNKSRIHRKQRKCNRRKYRKHSRHPAKHNSQIHKRSRKYNSNSNNKNRNNKKNRTNKRRKSTRKGK